MGLDAEAWYDMERLYIRDPGSKVAWELLEGQLSHMPVASRLDRLRRLAKALPRDERVLRRNARECLENNDASGAWDALQALHALKPGDSQVTITAAQVADHLGLTGEAQGLYRAASLSAGDSLSESQRILARRREAELSGSASLPPSPPQQETPSP